MLSDKDCELVYELVFSAHRAVGQAAGEFLNERLFLPEEEIDPDLRTKRGKKRLPNTPLIRDLVSAYSFCWLWRNKINYKLMKH